MADEDTENIPSAPGEDDQEPNILEQVSNKLDADLYVYSGPVDESEVESVIDTISETRSRKNVALILATYGGSADAAFRLCNFLRCTYEKLILFIPGYCKSAGTLIAIGAHEIVMTSRGELGPLDVQLPKKDDLATRASGLDVSDALDFISGRAFQVFEEQFLSVIQRSLGQITTKTAGDIATAITIGLMAPITEQIDPLALGESQRAMTVAFEYGRLLGCEHSALEKLIVGYPSHGFVIDRKQAQKLFPHVREADELEIDFLKELDDFLGKQLSVKVLRIPHPNRLIFCPLIPPLVDDPEKAASTSNENPSTTSSSQSVQPNGENEDKSENATHKRETQASVPERQENLNAAG